MMALSLLLFILSLSTANAPLYWQFVANARADGCHVYNVAWVSCPGMHVAGMIPIPDDAVEVTGPMAPAPKPDQPCRMRIGYCQ